jgi:hypothetical protein
VKTIVPPPEYRARKPNLTGGPEASGLDPSDALRRIFVLPNGYLAVQGSLVDQTVRQGNNVAVSYSQFVDLHSPAGEFVRRLHQNDLRLGEARFLGVDAETGEFYFADKNTLYVAILRW